MMRNILVLVILVESAVRALAQQPSPPDIKLFASSEEVRKIVAEIKAVRKNEPLIGRPLLRLVPYRANVEYMGGIAPAAIHPKEAEIFLVLEGSGTMVTGGVLTDEKQSKSGTILGTGITGGTSREIAKGDMLIVPEGVPHFISKINGELILMTLHVPSPFEAGR